MGGGGGGGWGVITKLESFLCILGYFLEVNLQNGDIFGCCYNFKYYF